MLNFLQSESKLTDWPKNFFLAIHLAYEDCLERKHKSKLVLFYHGYKNLTQP